MNTTMRISFWLFAILSTYRVVHSLMILYRILFVKKVYEWFIISITTATLISGFIGYAFSTYVYMSVRKDGWKAIYINLMFASFFGCRARRPVILLIAEILYELMAK